MRIHVESLETAHFWWRVRFGERVWQPKHLDFTTDSGTRALRVIQHHIGEHVVRFSNDRTVEITRNRANKIEPAIFETHDALQHTMDGFEHTRLLVEFEPPTITTAEQPATKLRKMEDIERLPEGQQVTIEQTLRLSLPAAERDVRRLRALRLHASLDRGGDQYVIHTCNVLTTCSDTGQSLRYLTTEIARLIV